MSTQGPVVPTLFGLSKECREAVAFLVDELTLENDQRWGELSLRWRRSRKTVTTSVLSRGFIYLLTIGRVCFAGGHGTGKPMVVHLNEHPEAESWLPGVKGWNPDDWRPCPSEDFTSRAQQPNHSSPLVTLSDPEGQGKPPRS
jgi:hypothetical protein